MRRLLLALLLPLCACAGFDEALEDARLGSKANPAPCPNVFVLEEAARLVDFGGAEPSVDTVAWSAEVRDVRTSCRYADDLPINARVEIDLAVGRGPAATGDEYPLSYFVAVTRTDKDLIAKETFTVPVTIRDGRAVATFTERLTDVVIPRKGEETSGTNFEIAVGLALTKEQLLYNRSGRSLKFPGL